MIIMVLWDILCPYEHGMVIMVVREWSKITGQRGWVHFHFSQVEKSRDPVKPRVKKSHDLVKLREQKSHEPVGRVKKNWYGHYGTLGHILSQMNTACWLLYFGTYFVPNDNLSGPDSELDRWAVELKPNLSGPDSELDR